MEPGSLRVRLELFDQFKNPCWKTSKSVLNKYVQILIQIERLRHILWKFLSKKARSLFFFLKKINEELVSIMCSFSRCFGSIMLFIFFLNLKWCIWLIITNKFYAIQISFFFYNILLFSKTIHVFLIENSA